MSQKTSSNWQKIGQIFFQSHVSASYTILYEAHAHMHKGQA